MRIESLRELQGQFPDIDGFWDFENLENTEMRIQQHFPQASEDWSPSAIEALTQLARLQALQSRFPEAKETLNKVQSLLSQVHDPAARTRIEIRYLLEQGRILCLQMTPLNAQTFFNQAWILALKSQNVFFAVDAALMLSIIQPPKFQNDWLQKALELAITTEDERAKLWLAQLYMMDAWRSFDRHRYAEALESFEKAETSPRLPKDKRTELLIQWGKARVLRSLKEPQRSLDIQKNLLAEMKELNQENGHVYLELAESLQALEQHDEAKPYFELAFKTLSDDPWFSDNKADELLRMQYLSKRH